MVYNTYYYNTFVIDKRCCAIDKGLINRPQHNVKDQRVSNPCKKNKNGFARRKSSFSHTRGPTTTRVHNIIIIRRVRAAVRETKRVRRYIIIVIILF